MLPGCLTRPEVVVWTSSFVSHSPLFLGSGFSISPFLVGISPHHRMSQRPLCSTLAWVVWGVKKFGHFVEAASLYIAEAPLDVCLEMDTKILV